MDPVSWYIIILVMLIICSAFFSSAETAFSSVNKIRLRNYVEEKRRGAKRALKIAENFDNTIATILIGNNIVNIASATIATALFTEIFEELYSENIILIISTFVMTFIVLIFGEIVPKSLAKQHAERFTMMFGGVLSLIIVILKPVATVFLLFKKLVIKLFNRGVGEEPSVTEDELEHIIDTMEEEGVIEEEKSEMLHSVLDLTKQRVKDILTPRVDIIALNVNSTAEATLEVFVEQKFSRIPVYEDRIDNIVGVLYERDFLLHVVDENELDLSEIMRKPMFVPSSMIVIDLLQKLQLNKQHMAIVTDEYGGTAGLVTLEDVLEELVGEIYDEHDDEELYLVKKSDTEFIAHADVDLDDIFDELQVKINNADEYKTLGGWLHEHITDVPEEGMSVVYKAMVDHHDIDREDEYVDIRFTIIETVERRMLVIKIEKLDEEQMENEKAEERDESEELNE